jgi:hypothetical protein
VLFEIINDNALPQPLRGHSRTLSDLAEAYKAINAPTGSLGLSTLVGLSTPAIAGDNATYGALEDKITELTSQRNAIAADMIGMLEGAAFQGLRIDENEAKTLTDKAGELLGTVGTVSR